MDTKIAFIGLGVMGAPMARHLVDSGFSLTVTNRTEIKTTRWLGENSAAGANTPKTAATPKEAVIDADFIISCIGNDDDLWDICCGETGLLASAKPGAIFIDHSTTSSDIARKVHEKCQQKNIGFLDAPVSGGEQGAINGALTVMCGGKSEHFELAKPIIASYAKAITLMGDSGSGQLTKMVNQITICGLIQSLAEGLQFAENAGLDTTQVMGVISQGAAQSWQMDNRHETMIRGEYNHGFAVDLIRKDLGIVFDEAQRNKSSLPVAQLVDQYYAEIQEAGGGRFDTSSLLTRFDDKVSNK